MTEYRVIFRYTDEHHNIKMWDQHYFNAESIKELRKQIDDSEYSEKPIWAVFYKKNNKRHNLLREMAQGDINSEKIAEWYSKTELQTKYMKYGELLRAKEEFVKYMSSFF